jgi:uncharacterized membrane protein
MTPLGIHYFPVTLPFVLLLLAVLIALTLMALLRVLQFAYGRLGMSPRYFFFWLFLSLAGSSINIPLMRLPGGHILGERIVNIFGVPHVVPGVKQWPATVLAINVGGAVIPILLSLYLMARNRLYAQAAVGTMIVAIVCWWLAYPVQGIGIAIPIFYPPLIAAAVALALSRAYAAPLAYICGSLGTLIGADLMNLDKIRGMGAPVASIGGAGTFDGIFVTGLLAVLLAGIVSRARLAHP